MEHISLTVPVAEQIEIVPMGDLHLGSPNCRVDKFKRMVEYIQKTPNCYTILMGDLIDAIYADDKRFDMSEKSEAFLETLDKLQNILMPIKDKILCMLLGNHEFTLKKKGLGDPVLHLTSQLNVKYGGFSCFLRIKAVPKTHQKSLTIYLHHGWFGGRQRGAKVNSIERLAQHFVADAFLVAHSHDLFSTRSVRVDYGGARKLLFGNTGSFVETATKGTCNYSERAGYPPQKLGSLKISWMPYTGKMYCSE